MKCAGCVQTVEEALRGTKGVSDVSVDLKSGQATVKYDPAATSPDKIKKVADASGYPAAVIS